MARRRNPTSKALTTTRVRRSEEYISVQRGRRTRCTPSAQCFSCKGSKSPKWPPSSPAKYCRGCLNGTNPNIRARQGVIHGPLDLWRPREHVLGLVRQVGILFLSSRCKRWPGAPGPMSNVERRGDGAHCLARIRVFGLAVVVGRRLVDQGPVHRPDQRIHEPVFLAVGLRPTRLGHRRVSGGNKSPCQRRFNTGDVEIAGPSALPPVVCLHRDKAGPRCSRRQHSLGRRPSRHNLHP